MELAEYSQSKIAFYIPKEYQRETNESYRGQVNIPEKLVDELMDLFEDTEFEHENICNNDLLIVSIDFMPTPEWFSESLTKINKVLKKWDKKNTKTKA